MRWPLTLAMGLAALLLPQTQLYAQAPTSTPDAHMSILVHITHGPENPTRAALGFAVAAAAAEQGHEVTVFLAGDAVQLARGEVVDQLAGLGTGRLSESLDRLLTAGARFFLSGGSSAARGLASEQVILPHFEMAGPSRLVELSLEHDRQFVY